MPGFDLEKLTLGALMHDIGKLKQRAHFPEDQGKNHSLIGYEWLAGHYGEGIIAAAARDHHGAEKETWESNITLLIYEADNLAASERKSFDKAEDVEKTWQHDLLLASVFNRISLDPNKNLSQATFWPLTPLGGWFGQVQSPFDESGKAYPYLWRGFSKNFEWLKEKEYHLYVEPNLYLLEKFTSLVPSMTLRIVAESFEASLRKQQDISFFDHARITAATARCLAIYIQETYPTLWDRQILKEQILEGWENDSEIYPFLLIGGDLSGVQNFLYTISAKGALKSLKGRSFYLELLTDYVIDRLLKTINLTRCNVIFQGGGHFYILGPNIKNAEKQLAAVRTEVNDYLFDSFNGALLQLIEWVPMGKWHFRDASDIWTELSARLNEAKRKKWADRLDRVFSPPQMPHSDCLTQNCSVCGREDLELSKGETPMCPPCKEQFTFGEKLQRVARELDPRSGKTVTLAVMNQKPESLEGVLSIGSKANRLYYQPLLIKEKEGFQHFSNPLVLYHINEWDVKKLRSPFDRFFLAAVHHPQDLEDLESYIDKGFGWNKAAVLRMDVDRLGEIFHRGFPKEDRTFSRLASLSRFLSLFFKYHLNGILGPPGNGYEKLKRTNLAGRQQMAERGLSLVYSGGDDIFLVGRWLDVLEAAFDIHDSFLQFTGNDGITLSGGFKIENSQYPIYRFAKDAGEAENQAKSHGRNAQTLISGPFSWQEVNEIRKAISEEIIPLLNKAESFLDVIPGSISKGFLYRLFALISNHNPENQWVLPKMAYAAGRNGPVNKWLLEHPEGAKAWVALKNRLFKLPEKRNLQILKETLLWVLMMMRKGGEK